MKRRLIGVVVVACFVTFAATQSDARQHQKIKAQADTLSHSQTFSARKHHKPHRTKRPIRIAHISCDDRGCHDSAVAQDSPKRVRGYRTAAPSGGFTGGLVAQARGYLGMTAGQIGLKRHTAWCAAFLRHLGVALPDDRAISGLSLPRCAGPQPGCLAVSRHHISIVTGIAPSGNPITISGNSNGRRVYEGEERRGRIIAYVMPG